MEDYNLVTFKTLREREIEIGREYTFDPLGVGECRVVREDKESKKIKDGDIAFVKVGPVNLIPFVKEYETDNARNHKGSKKSILEGKHGLTERELILRERSLIN